MNNIVEQIRLIYVEINENSNKFWNGTVTDNGTMTAEWGRVGYKAQSKTHQCGSVSAARNKLNNLYREKLAKGYTEVATIDREKGISVVPTDLKAIATSQIKADDVTKSLIEYLVQVNIHQITAHTTIKYNAENGAFTTPLGAVTPQAISEARSLLNALSTMQLGTHQRHQTLGAYLRLIPQNLGMKLKADLFSTTEELQEQSALLDSLSSALQVTSNKISGQVFDCSLLRVSAHTESGKQTFRKLKSLYESTINKSHVSASLKMKAVYEVEIVAMQQAFSAASKRLGNVHQMWHGTKSSNLLSILKSGLIIPPSSSQQVTGRMFGDGLYFSTESTKSLNYATSFWNRSGMAQQRTFMFLAEVAMGKICYPTDRNRRFPVPGYDSVWIRPGTCGVINQEAIVYSTEQVNLKYLIEFAA